jgi:hypothetical protein
MTPYASWKKTLITRKPYFTWLVVLCLLLTYTNEVIAQSPFVSSKQSVLLSNAQSGVSERWAAIFFPTTATANYRLILPGTAPTSGQFLSIASVSGNDATLQWSNIAASSWSLTGNTGLTDGTNNLLGTTDNIPVRILTNNAERIRILGGGNVGIGITAPTQRLHIAGNTLIGTGNQLQLQNPAGTFVSTFSAGTQTSTINYTLPITAPSAGQFLSSDASGVMSWATALTGTTGWALVGNAPSASWNGTSGSFLGTTNAQPLSIATTNATAQDIRFYTGVSGANERMRIASNGFVGIGTTGAPGYSLQVNGSTIYLHNGATPFFYATGTNVGIGSSATPGNTLHVGGRTSIGFNYNVTAPTNGLIVEGNVGLGITNPTTRLHIDNGNASPTLISITNGTTSGTTANDGFVFGLNADASVSLWNRENTQMVFATNNTEAMRITATGNVGIGTTTPNAALQLANVISNRRIVLWEVSNDDHSFYGLGINSGVLRFQVAATSNDFTFNSAASSSASNEIMRVRGNGTVGVGLTTPTSRLHIDGGTATDTYLTFTNGATTGQTVTDGFVVGTQSDGTGTVWTRESAGIRFGTSDAERMRIVANGSVGIGTNNPSVGLHYVGNNTILTSSAGQTQNVSNHLLLGNLNNASYELRIQEPNGSGSNYNALKSQVQAYDIRYTFPAVVPNTNQVLGATTIAGSAGAGYDVSLEWVDNTLSGGGSTVSGSGVIGEVAFWTTSTQLTSDPRFFWDDGLLRLGIGTNTPDEKLDVEGHLLVSNGNSLANELRIAEPFYTTGNLNYTGFTTQAQAGNLTYTLPGAGPANGNFGTNRFVMATNLAGSSATLGWETFWSPQGNAGTNPANAFIGTTDNQPLVFRTNNTEQMRILSNSQLQLRSGNGAASFTGNQLVMGWNGASDYQYMHAIKTRHNSGGVTENAIDFYIWRQGTDAATASPTLHGLTIEGASGATSNVGIGGVTSPKANLHLPPITANRKVILFLDNDNDHQFYGFGINSGILRYQLSNTSASHVFYAGASASTSNELMRIQGNGNVGIGTPTPSARLEVSGSGAGNIDFVVNGRMRTGDATGNGGIWLTNANDAFVGNNGANVGFFTSGPGWSAFQIVKASGNVGIGTQSPTTRLQVNGTSRFVGGSMLIDTISSGTAGQIQLMNPARTFQTNIQAGAQTANITYTLPTTAPTAGQILSSDASGNMSWVTSSSGWSLSGNTTTSAWNGSTGSFLGTTSAFPMVIATTNATAQDIRFFTGANGANERMRILGTGNVGIGNTAPSQALEVTGTVYVNSENSALTVDALANSRLGLVKKAGSDPVITAGSGTDIMLGNWSTPQINGNIASGTFNERMRIRTSGEIGIGISAPASAVHIDRGNGIASALQFTAGATTGQTQNDGFSLGITATGSAEIKQTEAQPISFFTSNTERLRILSSGNVGLGTTAPTARLHVNGTSRFSGGDMLIDTSASSTAGQLQLMNPARTFQTNIQAGAQTANITYTLPTATPTTNGQILSATTGGVMSWTDPSAIVAGTQFLRKTADEFLSSNATLQNDDHLTFSIPANQSYELEVVLHVTTDNATNGGIQFTVTSPAGSTVFLSTSTATTIPLGENIITASGTTDNITTLNTTRNKVVLKGYVLNSSTPGSVTLQWAQQSSSTGEVRVKSGSYMKITRIQ